MICIRRLISVGAAVTVLLVASGATAWAQNTLRVVMHSDLEIIDPIWTTAYIVRNHGHMIYDTLFAWPGYGCVAIQWRAMSIRRVIQTPSCFSM